MKALILSSLLGFGLLAQPATAKDFWTTLNESAPRSIFNELRDSAPRSIFDQIRDSAPLWAGDAPDQMTGELAPVFETLRDKAP